MQPTKNKLETVEYTKANKETSERVIIPTYIPQPNIKALDVTELTEDRREDVLEMVQEYSDYVAQQQKTIFSFEDWLEHSKQIDSTDVKWRTFKLDGLKIV